MKEYADRDLHDVVKAFYYYLQLKRKTFISILHQLTDYGKI